MSNETPNLPCGHHHSMLIKSVESDYTACELCDIRSQRNDAIEMERMYRAENARLREEVEMLNVRHAAAMLHAQTHADEYNALREDEKGLLQDIQRLTEEAFKRDEKLAIQSNANVGLMEELAEAKRELELSRAVAHLAKLGAEQAEARALEYKTEHAALLGTSQWQETEIADLRDDVKRLMQIASECEERALAAEKSHMDLIMQVARKWPNESRHETAKRYIMEAKNRPWSGPDQAAVGAKHD